MKNVYYYYFVALCSMALLAGCGAETDIAQQTVKDRIVGSWGVGMDFDQQKYSVLLDKASQQEAEKLNQAIDGYKSISIQVEFKSDGTYVGTMRDEAAGRDTPIEGTWEITDNGVDSGRMNITHGPPDNPSQEQVDVEFLGDDRFRTQMFGMPQQVKGIFYWSYSKNRT